MDLKSAIRTIPDYPKPGIMFRDVTTLIGDARAFRVAVDRMVQPWAGAKIDRVAGTEARGFILGGAVAHQLSVGFTPVRKRGKLPHRTLIEEYELEYGQDAIEIHVDAIQENDRVLLVDDLIATGGTAEASIRLRHRPARPGRCQTHRSARRAGLLAGAVRRRLAGSHPFSPAGGEWRSLQHSP